MEIQKKLEEFGKAFEDFKKANDAKLAEIEKKGYASADKTELVEKLEGKLSTLEKQIETMNAALARTQAGGEGTKTTEPTESEEYKKALFGYMRKGRELTQAQQEWAQKAMSVDSDTDGGFLVTPEMSSEIVKKVFETSPMRQLASQQTISSGSLKILEDLDEAGAGWVGETETRSETTTPTINEVEIPVHEMYAEPKATQTLLDDAAVNLEQWLNGKVSEKFSRMENTSFISGNGVKKPKGILAYASGTSFGQVERQLTAVNSAMDGDDLISVQALLKEPYQLNASWLINRLLISTIRKFKDTNTGQYLWQPGLTAGSPNQLLGRPVYMAADLPTAFAATTDLIIYGDIRAAYQIVDRIGIRVLRDPFTAKPYVKFYTTKRVGGGVKNFEAVKVLKGKT